MDRVVIFIDGANMFHGLIEEFDNIQIDYGKLAQKLTDNRKLIRTYYYTALPDQNKEPDRYRKQQRFLSTLQKLHYFKVVLGRLEPRENTYVEKGVDIALAVDMLEMAFRNVYDVGIVLSGDGDMAKAIEVVQRMGKQIEVACIKSKLSYNLSQVSDKSICLDKEYLKDCWQT